MKVNKAQLDNVIKLNKNLYKSGNKYTEEMINDLIDAQNKAYGYTGDWISRIITGITTKNTNEPYETYYKVLNILEIEVEEE